MFNPKDRYSFLVRRNCHEDSVNMFSCAKCHFFEDCFWVSHLTSSYHAISDAKALQTSFRNHVLHRHEGRVCLGLWETSIAKVVRQVDDLLIEICLPRSPGEEATTSERQRKGTENSGDQTQGEGQDQGKHQEGKKDHSKKGHARSTWPWNGCQNIQKSAKIFGGFWRSI